MTRNDLGVGGALALAAATLLLTACSAGGPGDPAEERPADPAGAAAALPEGHPPLTGSAPATPSNALAGTVKETMDVAGYTYARLDVDGREIWTAGPVTALSEGERVAVADPMEMRGFHSGALDRTFDVIYFTGAFVKGASAADAARRAPSPEGVAAATTTGTVVNAIPAAGYTYVEVETAEGTRWLAGPATPLEAGAVVSWSGGSLMRGFESRALDRTFEEITFVDRLEVVARGG